MPTLEYDRLVFRFPEIEPEAQFAIDFQRTLRVPDTEQTYPLPAGLGNFPVRHVEDHMRNLPAKTAERGGVILPMWQAEAMWLNFSNYGGLTGLDFPVAIKVAAGKINAVSGDAWRTGLHRDPQDYMVSPLQPWLDGFAIEKGVIRQFVAMPLGDGCSVEEQVTGEAEWGGMQIAVTPVKREVWDRLRKEHANRGVRRRSFLEDCGDRTGISLSMMGMATGGRMKQAIYPDRYGIADWDESQTQRVFVSLVHGKDWTKVTGEPATRHPPSPKKYAEAKIPWFDYYGADTKDCAALLGSEKLEGVKSVANKFKETTGSDLASADDVVIEERIVLHTKREGFREVK